ncbi:MAG: AbrB/MazE/SpoVT family DNA-binding domain-containing protein [Trueperaceae bacterium]
MELLKIDKFGRVLLPKKMREALGVIEGESVEADLHKGELVLRAKKSTLIRKGKVLVFDVAGDEDIRSAIEWSRDARDKTILGEDEDSV